MGARGAGSGNPRPEPRSATAPQDDGATGPVTVSRGRGAGIVTSELPSSLGFCSFDKRSFPSGEGVFADGASERSASAGESRVDGNDENDRREEHRRRSTVAGVAGEAAQWEQQLSAEDVGGQGGDEQCATLIVH